MQKPSLLGRGHRDTGTAAGYCAGPGDASHEPLERCCSWSDPGEARSWGQECRGIYINDGLCVMSISSHLAFINQLHHA